MCKVHMYCWQVVLPLAIRLCPSPSRCCPLSHTAIKCTDCCWPPSHPTTLPSHEACYAFLKTKIGIYQHLLACHNLDQILMFAPQFSYVGYSELHTLPTLLSSSLHSHSLASPLLLSPFLTAMVAVAAVLFCLLVYLFMLASSSSPLHMAVVSSIEC